MSYNDGAGPAPDGVVRNSALSFLAPAQRAQVQPEARAQESTSAEQTNQSERLVPAGLKALCDACSQLYPDQPNPLQVTTRLKYWLGGQDPLDYISMYWNPGSPEECIPPHWHYISFGLSDLHGDGRVHPPPDRVLLAAAPPPPSGFGIELTLRLEAQPGAPPPLWPASLLQALARYVFTTGTRICAGDHISWHAALDGSAGRKPRVRHLLVARDAALPHAVPTPHGAVDVLQIVGCTGRELRAAQRGSAHHVLQLMRDQPGCGGPWLVTSLRRARSVRGAGGARPAGAAPAGAAPAQLAGVSASLRWLPLPADTAAPQRAGGEGAPGGGEGGGVSGALPASVQRQIKETLQRGLTTMSADRGASEVTGHMSTDSFKMSSLEQALFDVPEFMQSSYRSEEGAGAGVQYLDGVHLVLNAESGSLLPLAIDGRVLHGHHFTWRGCGRAATVLAEDVAGALATTAKPYAAQGGWVQILIPKDLALDISSKVACLARLADTDSEPDSDGEGRERETPSLPLTLAWTKHNLKITIVQDVELL